MTRALTLGLMLIATAVGAADLQLATRHDELRAPSRASPSRKVQWAPSGNVSALHARAAFGSETETASHPYAREEGKTAAGAGIFLSRDSVEGQLNSAPSLHRFVYGHANPLRYTDPRGRDAMDLWRLVTAPPTPQQTPLDRSAAEAVRNSPSVLYSLYEHVIDQAHAGADLVGKEVSYESQALTRATGSNTIADLSSAAVAAGVQFATSIPFGVINLATRPHRVVEGIGSIPSRILNGVRTAADERLTADKRIIGGAQAAQAFFEGMLLVTGAAEALGIEGARLGTLRVGNGARAAEPVGEAFSEFAAETKNGGDVEAVFGAGGTRAVVDRKEAGSAATPQMYRGWRYAAGDEPGVVQETGFQGGFESKFEKGSVAVRARKCGCGDKNEFGPNTYEFQTPVKPSREPQTLNGDSSGWYYWDEGAPGVLPLEGDGVKIPAEVTRIGTPKKTE